MLLRPVLIGGFVAALACASVGMIARAHAADEEISDGAQDGRLDRVPAPVKATIERESAGGRITDISQGTLRGQTAYEVKIAREGQASKVYVAADGTVLQRAGDDDDDDD